MRPRERILQNLESIYRESFDRAKDGADEKRMADLDNAYMRDQLMLEILLDIRDLFAVAPAASAKGTTALEKLETTTDQLAAAMRRVSPRRLTHCATLNSGTLSIQQMAEFTVGHVERHQAQLDRVLAPV